MYRLSAQELRAQFLNKKVSAKEIATYFLKRIHSFDPQIGAFLRTLDERVLKKAEALDAKLARGEKVGRLAGVPIGIKDNIALKGEITSCASKILKDFRSTFDATALHYLEAEDALLIGRTNLDEFALGSSTESSAFQITRNPWNLDCVPGGSSGGSGAAVAARLCPIALGSDTGGSIRQPAALCGIVGFKGTYGRISRYGLVAFGSSLDQIGPFSTNVEDAALATEVMSGVCRRDATYFNNPLPPFSKCTSLKGKKIGVPWKLIDHVSDEGQENFKQSVATLKELGAEIVDVNLHVLKYGIAVYYILSTAELSTNLSRFDGIRYGHRSEKATTLEEVYSLSREEGFGPEVKQRILLGNFVLSSGYQDAYYVKAQKVRRLIFNAYKEALEKCDAIAMPTAPTPTFKVGELQDPLQLYLQDIFTVTANLAGVPGISLPSGFSKENKPFALQLLAWQGEEAALFSIASAFESAARHNQQIPPLFDKEAP